jgi:hypothetical protein
VIPTRQPSVRTLDFRQRGGMRQTQNGVKVHTEQSSVDSRQSTVVSPQSTVD